MVAIALLLLLLLWATPEVILLRIVEMVVSIAAAVAGIIRRLKLIDPRPSTGWFQFPEFSIMVVSAELEFAKGSSWMGGAESNRWWVLPVAMSEVEPPPPLNRSRVAAELEIGSLAMGSWVDREVVAPVEFMAIPLPPPWYPLGM